MGFRPCAPGPPMYLSIYNSCRRSPWWNRRNAEYRFSSAYVKIRFRRPYLPRWLRLGHPPGTWEVLHTVASPPSIVVKCAGGGGGGSSCSRLWCCSGRVFVCVTCFSTYSGPPSPRHLRSLLSEGGGSFVWSFVVYFLSCVCVSGLVVF